MSKLSPDAAVAAQYEALPYPHRDPREERKRLIVGSPSHLQEIEQSVFGGRWPNRPVRVLIAGGGSGDALTMLAQQLAWVGRKAEILYLDPSHAARAVAEARIAARGLDASETVSINFAIGSLLDLPTQGHDPFDYIDSCGVLHHLDDPDAGLRALVSVLAPHGGIGLMLYGAYGRRGVYDVQAILRTLAAEGSPSVRVSQAKRVLAQLPSTNWLRRNGVIRDHLDGGDAGLFDLLLHARDRAYTIPDWFALIHGAGLRLAEWVEPARYRLNTYFTDPGVLKRAESLSSEAEAALAEQVAGNLARHAGYLVRAENPIAPPPPGDRAAIPAFKDIDPQRLLAAMDRGGRLTVGNEGLDLTLPLPTLAAAVLPRIDGLKTWQALLDEVKSLRKDLSDDTLGRAAEHIARQLGGIGRLTQRYGV
jgi:SAM-dependent methyltransferase